MVTVRLAVEPGGFDLSFGRDWRYVAYRRMELPMHRESFRSALRLGEDPVFAAIAARAVRVEVDVDPYAGGAARVSAMARRMPRPLAAAGIRVTRMTRRVVRVTVPINALPGDARVEYLMRALWWIESSLLSGRYGPTPVVSARALGLL